ncbi:hypothetical protein [Flavihumibacter sp. CACIAM 22H1]|uniref:hypothetical protein n=1 Tax=Flavihumibacter sp. CACIAM 22H1 TaxID=1812911 RepID=UPI0007A8350C|nr:hypothetical protein [Flavihumibacter sp. CACIAM 22H1]KYP13481.1 MAG: hypothetical protein A1D16_12345 [Flavihumibacter sp. CACIAM 22H1]
MNKNRTYWLAIVIGLCCSVSLSAQSFHSLELEGASGRGPLQVLQGKKVLIVLSAVDTTVDFTGLDDLQKTYGDLVVVELPVKRLSKAVALPKPVNTLLLVAQETADSTDTNGRLLRWLTQKGGNQHFEVEKLEVGQKFFVDGKGELYAILPPDFTLTDPRIHAVLTRTAFPEPDNN